MFALFRPWLVALVGSPWLLWCVLHARRLRRLWLSLWLVPSVLGRLALGWVVTVAVALHACRGSCGSLSGSWLALRPCGSPWLSEALVALSGSVGWLLVGWLSLWLFGSFHAAEALVVALLSIFAKWL